ncbi:MAG: glycoside-pentoside-hexuronide (GPH):cation symporter [Clostridia bacterium]|nr:glycoside-pentoside-hexuronide (GPH):cation symporter [Clostridia bacterium]
MNETSSGRKLTKRDMIGYGSAGYATIFTFTIIITYGMYYFTDVVGMSAGVAGMLLGLGTLVDAITDPLIGSLSDKRDPAKGRRRPFLLAAAVPFGLVTWLLYTDWGFGQTGTIVYFAIMICCFYVVQTLVDVPLTSLGSEMTTDYDERTNLSSIRYTWATIGGIVTGFTFAMVTYFADLCGGSEAKGWSITCAIFGVLCTITILISYFTTKGKEHPEYSDEAPFSLKESFKIPFSVKPYKFVAFAFFFGIIAQTVDAACLVYYLSYNLGLTENEQAIGFTLMWVVAFAWIALTNWVAMKYSKKVAWNYSMIIWSLALVLFIWVILKPGMEHLVFWSVVMQSVSTFGYNAIYQVTWAAIPDCVELDELKTGQRREGLFYSIASLIQKAGAAVAAAVCGWIITGFGYDPELEVQSDGTLTGFLIMKSFGVIIFLVISIIITARNPMTKQNHAKLMEAVELKRAGKEYTTEGFEELL